MRRTVIIAVPDGASALASWCSSMTSAVSKYGAASSAKRIMRTAPMAKFGAIRQLDRVNADRSAATSSSVKPVVPTTACSPCSPHHGTLTRAASRTVRSSATCTPAASIAAGSSATSIPSTVPPARRRATAATSSSSGSAAIAAHAIVPIRPVAPNTPTRTGPLAVIAAPYPSSPHGRSPDGVRRARRTVREPGPLLTASRDGTDRSGEPDRSIGGRARRRASGHEGDGRERQEHQVADHAPRPDGPPRASPRSRRTEAASLAPGSPRAGR